MVYEKCIQIEFASGFRGEDVVLAAMTVEGVECLLKALRMAADSAARENLLEMSPQRVLIRVADVPMTIGEESGTLVWTLSMPKLQEVAEKLTSLRNASGPCHHYLDIAGPVNTLVLSRDEYI